MQGLSLADIDSMYPAERRLVQELFAEAQTKRKQDSPDVLADPNVVKELSGIYGTASFER